MEPSIGLLQIGGGGGLVDVLSRTVALLQDDPAAMDVEAVANINQFAIIYARQMHQRSMGTEEHGPDQRYSYWFGI